MLTSLRRLPLLLVAGVVLLASLAAGGALPPPADAAEPGPVRERVFVTLAGRPALAAVPRERIDTRGTVTASTLRRLREHRDALRATQRKVVSAARDAGLDVQAHRFVTGLANGVAMTVPAGQRQRLADLPGVTAVQPDTRYRAHTDTSVPLVGAPQVWRRHDPDGTLARGDGTVVAILDTGVDYTHPDLGGGFGEGHKVVDGHDFVNDDADPRDDNGHGTHVAGIVAADGTAPDGVRGVAPHARLTAYKVLDSDGAGYQSDILAGLEAAVDPAAEHRADVINLSLGGPGDGTDPLGRAATEASRLGVVVVAAAGNSGPGAGTVNSPAAAPGVLSVGASTSGIVEPTAHMTSPRRELLQTYRAPYSAAAPAEPVSGALVDVGQGTEADYARVGDVSGKVLAYQARVPRDLTGVTPDLLDQARRAEDKGALALLAYAPDSGPVTDRDAAGPAEAEGDPATWTAPLRPGPRRSGDSFRMDRLVVLGLADLQWPRLRAQLAEGPVEVEISGQDVTDRIASFSSRGPVAGSFEPGVDLVAPGTEIRSTWPTAQWEPGVYRMSGTSMAAPHAAGAAALLRQLHPDEPADRLRTRLTGAAHPTPGAPVTAQGAGRLDVAAAARAPLTASPGSLTLGLADLAGKTVRGTARTTLRNNGNQPVTVRLRTERPDGGAGRATVTPKRVTLPAGGEATVTVTVTGPGGHHDGDRDLAGWLVAEPRDGGPSTLRVPYLLAARPLAVHLTPDPAADTTSAFVRAPGELEQPPTLTVTPPHGRPHTVTTRHDHGTWYRAELRVRHGAGAHTVTARATTADGTRLTGGSAVETLPKDNRPGGRRWRPVGPNGEAGALATTPADPDTAVLTQHGTLGPWATDDAGRTWRQLGRLPVAAGTGGVVVDGRDPRRLWYAVNGSTGGVLDTVLDPTYAGRLLRSEDGGHSWRRLAVPDVHIEALVSDPDTRALAVVTADAVLLSHDGGDHFTSLPNPLGERLVGAAIGGDDLYLAGALGVWAVRGVTHPGGEYPVARVHDAAAEPLTDLVADEDLVAVLTEDDRVLGSRDAGGDWRELYRVPGGGSTSMVLRAGTLAVFTYHEQQFLGRDHGTDWSAVPQPVPGAVENDMVPWRDDTLLWSSPGAGVFATGRDGGDPRRIGVQGVTAHDLAVARDTAGRRTLLAGTDADVARTALPTGPVTPDTAEWGLTGREAHVGQRVGQLAVSPEDPRTVWKIRKDALSQFHVSRSTDGGETWTTRGSTTQTPFDLAVGPRDDQRVAVAFWSLTGQGLYVTRDGGKSWRKLMHQRLFTAVATDPTDPDRLWLGGEDGLYRSDDFGATVTKVADGPVEAVAVSPDGRRIVAGGDRLRVSDDGGRHFRAADTGPLPLRVADLAFSPSDPDTLYAATRAHTVDGLPKGGRGVLRSTDGGRTWVNVSGGLANLSVVSLALSADGRWLFAGTEHGGVHRLRTA